MLLKSTQPQPYLGLPLLITFLITHCIAFIAPNTGRAGLSMCKQHKWNGERAPWLKDPWNDIWTQSFSDSTLMYEVTLVSAAIGELYEQTLDTMQYHANSMGFTKAILWKKHDLDNDPLMSRFQVEISELQRQRVLAIRRPICAAFKPIALIRALAISGNGDTLCG